MLSLAMDHPVDATTAMTGELTVTGKVLRIGGLREKAVAARRSGAKTILFPKDNLSDWLELPEVSYLPLRYDYVPAEHAVNPFEYSADVLCLAEHKGRPRRATSRLVRRSIRSGVSRP
jgi:predicted ATP-dependent protease